MFSPLGRWGFHFHTLCTRDHPNKGHILDCLTYLLPGRCRGPPTWWARYASLWLVPLDRLCCSFPFLTISLALRNARVFFNCFCFFSAWQYVLHHAQCYTMRHIFLSRKKSGGFTSWLLSVVVVLLNALLDFVMTVFVCPHIFIWFSSSLCNSTSFI